MTNYNFIQSPEIKLILSNKSLPAKFKSKDAKSSQPSVSQQVKFTPRELELLQKLNKLELEKISTNENKSDEKSKKDKTTALTLSDVKGLKKELGEATYLCDVIDGADFRLPENEIFERNPVLEKRIQRLKREQEQRVYNSMTKNVDSSRKFEPEETISYQRKFRMHL
jgi:Endoplasmic reticulum-based factor for assembly of V-ATPase